MKIKKFIGYLLLSSVVLVFLATFVYQHGLWQTVLACAIFGAVALILFVGVSLIES